jgi:spoIIIJ-associated protein
MSTTASARETLELMLGHLGLTFEIHEEERPAGKTLHIRTADPGRLIGRNGKVLDDLQYLLNRILNREEDAAHRVIVDVENYRQHQIQHMLKQVQAAAEAIRGGGPEIQLDPMNSFERRLVHNLFKDDPEIQSVSPRDDRRLKRITLRRRTAA